MPKHDDYFLPAHCARNEVVCVNCGSIFEHSPRVMSPQHTFHEAIRKAQEERDNEECRPPAKPPKLKPVNDDFVPTFIRVDPNDPNSRVLEATVKDTDGEIIRVYMSPPKGGE